MTANTGKTLSMGLVGVMVGYCCWPYVFGSGSTFVAQPSEAAPAIAASLLMPPIDPAPGRDPFRVAPRAPTIAEVSMAPAHDDAQTESQASPPIDSTDDSDTGTTESPGMLALSATFVRGDQRVALINGRVYSPGDPLADSGSSTVPFVVSEIFADRVVIERKGQTTEVSYSDIDSTLPSGVRPPAKIPAARPPAAAKRQSKNHGSSPPKRASTCPSPQGPQRP
jgi:hypothetical protein